MFSQFFRLADPVHPDDEREMTGVTGRDPGLRVPSRRGLPSA